MTTRKIGDEVRFGPMIGVVTAILPNGKYGVKWLRTVRGTSLIVPGRHDESCACGQSTPNLSGVCNACNQKEPTNAR